MKKYKKLIAVLSLITILFIVGCSNDSSKDNNGEKSDENSSSRLAIAQSGDLTTMDPQNSLDTNGERVFANMYSRLFKWDENTEIENDLVKSYDQIDDTTWEFTIREDVKFHNGDSLTAKDVEFSLTRVTTDETLREYTFFTQIVEVQALEDYKVKITTDGPMPTLFKVLAKSGGDILPKNYFEEKGVEEFQKAPVGSGPYKYVDWKRDDRVILEPFEDYYGDKPIWDEVIVRAISESSTRIAELLTGNVDIITQVPPNEWDRIDKEEDLDLLKGDTTRIMMLMLPTEEGTVTSDPRVRKAIDLAINQGAIVDSILNGSGVPVRTHVTKGVFGHNEDLYDTYIYDVEEAKRLLTEAGYPDGINVRFVAPRGRYLLDGEVAQLIGSMLSEAGINADMKLLEGSAFLDEYNSGKKDSILMIGLADGIFDSSYSLIRYSAAGAADKTGYSNDEIEDLFAKANRNLDELERKEQYERIQEIVAEEVPHVFLYQQKENYGVNKKVNFKPRLDEGIRFDNVTVN